MHVETLCTSYLFHHAVPEMCFTVVSCIEVTICFASFIAFLTEEPLITDNMEWMIISMTLFLLQGCRGYIEYRNHSCILREMKEITSVG
jgi:hypothetical protein